MYWCNNLRRISESILKKTQLWKDVSSQLWSVNLVLKKLLKSLYGLRDRYEKHHKLVISDEALQAAAKFADQYIADRFLTR